MDWTIFFSGLILVLFVSSEDSVEDVTYKLQYLKNIKLSFGGYQWQARCSIPCNKAYEAGQLNVTLLLDTTCSDFEANGLFRTAQTSPSWVWYLDNTVYLTPDSRGYCQFDVQFDHEAKTVPTGVCHKNWVTPSTCPQHDVSSDVADRGRTCYDLAKYSLHTCYNQTIFSSCCETCNLYRTTLAECPFGDLRPSCSGIEPFECYNPEVASTCCLKCHHMELDRHTVIEDCPYGNKDPDYCASISERECYYNASLCCESCYYMADQTSTDCMYGDRDSYCAFIVPNDCYDGRNSSACCRTCNDVIDLNNPDCAYGDYTDKCYSVARRDCYRGSAATTCCETCDNLANYQNQECIYGDKEPYCDDIDIPDCEETTVQTDCCETCEYYLANSCTAIANMDSCFSNQAYDCYNTTVRSWCCPQCLQLYKDNIYLGEGCNYGDYTPDACRYVEYYDCYTPTTEEKCCETCYYHRRHHLPDNCRYGDRAGWCNTIAPFDCYNATIEHSCCDTCLQYDQAAELGDECRYGDRAYDCYDRESYQCYNTATQTECCKHCTNIKQERNEPECIYGDRGPECEGIEAKDCYQLEDVCCTTCPQFESPLNLANCKYGDSAYCRHMSVYQCYDSQVYSDCCETCHVLNQLHNNSGSYSTTTDSGFSSTTDYNGGSTTSGGCIDRSGTCAGMPGYMCYDREDECCDTCRRLRIDVDVANCTYGDKRLGCMFMPSGACYNKTDRDICCYSCYQHENIDLPDDCRYGDRATGCGNPDHHTSQCYDDVRNRDCCETCYHFQTNIRNCQYGDKHVLCDNIHDNVHQCYNDTIYDTCCETCPSYEEARFPGCEFGDHIKSCEQSLCNVYKENRLHQCCNTCQSHLPTYPTTPYPYSTSTESQTNKPKASIAPIIGGVVGGVVLVVIVIIVACLILRGRKSSSPKGKMEFQQNGRDRYPVTFSRTLSPPNASTTPSNSSMTSPNTTITSVNSKPPQFTHQPGSTTHPYNNFTRQKPIKDEEVYDYIDDSDVKTVVSIPQRRPTLPDRGNVYMEPMAADDDEQYLNPSFTPDTDSHHYHVLEKDTATSTPQPAAQYHGYLKL